MQYTLGRKLALVGIAALLATQPGCGDSARSTEDPAPPDDAPPDATALDPLLFFTANVATSELALRVARADGSTALVATRQVRPEPYESFESFRYTGVRDRRGTFPYMVPSWFNASASPDGSWVLWKREDSSWDVLDGHDGTAIDLPSTRWEDSELKWSPDGQRFVGLELETCTLQAVTPADAGVARLAEFGALCSDRDFYVEFFFSPDGSKIAYVSYPPVHAPFRTGELHTIDVDGTRDRIVHPRAQTCRAGSPGSGERANPWSRFGDTLAFVALTAEAEEANRSIQFRTSSPDDVRSDRSNLFLEVPLSDNAPESSVGCEWSPRGDRVAFGTAKSLHSFSVKANAPASLTLSSWSNLAWSRDGAWLSFTERTDSAWSVHAMRTDGTGDRVIAEGITGERQTEVLWSSTTALYETMPTSSAEPDALYLYHPKNGGALLSSDAGEQYAWTPRGDRAVYQTGSGCGRFGATCDIASVLPDGSDEHVFTIPAMSVGEMIWLDDGDHIAGADEEGLWVQRVTGTRERTTVWASDDSDILVDYASWDRRAVY